VHLEAARELVAVAATVYHACSAHTPFVGRIEPERSMPHTKSAKKHQRQSEKRRLANRAVKKAIKTQLKRFLTVAGEGNAEKLQAEYNLAAKKLDKAAAKRVIHPNLAARKKSQLARKLRAKGETRPAK
jgi:small subunit ribosomal protein S20